MGEYLCWAVCGRNAHRGPKYTEPITKPHNQRLTQPRSHHHILNLFQHNITPFITIQKHMRSHPAVLPQFLQECRECPLQNLPGRFNEVIFIGPKTKPDSSTRNTTPKSIHLLHVSSSDQFHSDQLGMKHRPHHIHRRRLDTQCHSNDVHSLPPPEPRSRNIDPDLIFSQPISILVKTRRNLAESASDLDSTRASSHVEQYRLGSIHVANVQRSIREEILDQNTISAFVEGVHSE